jgi:lysozyme-like protein
MKTCRANESMSKWTKLAILSAVVLTGCSGAGPGDSNDNSDLTSGSGSGSGALSMATVIGLAHSAGVPFGNGLAMAGAIAAAESSLNPSESSTNGPTSGCPSGSVDRGLWQINSCYHSSVSATCAFNPSCNAKAMAQISSNGTNWSPWSTYKNGAYKKYLAAAEAAEKMLEGAKGDAGSGADSGGGSGSGSGDAGGSAGEGGYAFVAPRSMDRRHAVALTAGAVKTIPFTWQDSSGLAPPSDLWVEAHGRPVLQVTSVGDRPFARAGLDVVPIEPGTPYRVVVARSGEEVTVSLMRGTDDVVLTTQVSAGDSRTAANEHVADVVLPAPLWRTSVLSDFL